MDIGSEISEKIQMAIKAKLKKINAYVDDELPDYIMIMIANRKPEEQMTDSLSLFLGNNTKPFTKWLYELLSGLREKQSTNSSEVTQNVTKDVSGDALSEVVPEKPKISTSVENSSNDMSKSSRWDIQKRAKNEKDEQKIKESIESVVTAKSNVIKEAVIDILPETDDLFDEEIANGETLKSGKSLKSPVPESSRETFNVDVKKHASSVPKVDATTSSKSLVKSKSVLSQNHQHETKSRVDKKKSEKKTGDDRRESIISAHSSMKRSVSVKASKHSVSSKVTNKQELFPKESSSSQLSSSKSKKKKLKRSNDKESSSHKHKSSKSHTREWDRDKGRKQLMYVDSSTYSKNHDTKTSDRDDDDSMSSTKQFTRRISSSISTVTKPALYVSEDDSDGDMPVSSSVISKVAVPERRSRLPSSKQANRSLLLKAVHEAESSIKKHRLTNKSIEPVTEKNFKTKVEQHKKMAVDNLNSVNKLGVNKIIVRKISPKVSASSNVDQIAKASDKVKLQSASKSKNLKRKSTGDSSPQSKRITLVETNVVQTDADITNRMITDQSQQPDDSDQPKQIGDSRRIISRDSRPAVSKSKKTLIRNSADNSDGLFVYFDSRKLSAKDSTNDDFSSPSNVQLVKKDKRDTKPNYMTAKDGAKKPEQTRKSRAKSPCFIVTLDGTSKSEKLPSKAKSENKSVPFCPSPVQAPDDTEPTKTTSKSYEKIIISSKTSNLDSEKLQSKPADDIPTSDLELSNMREKLLKMQEETKKLKDLQLKHQVLLQKKVDEQNIKPDSKSIHIANVHFSATEKQITEHFSICGKVVRVTILKDPFTGYSKGFAYLEFDDPKAVDMAMALDGTSFCGRNINVSRKQNELAKVTIPSTISHIYASRSQRFALSRQYRQYSRSFSSVSNFRSWTKPTSTKNKTWVKPGFIPS